MLFRNSTTGPQPAPQQTPPGATPNPGYDRRPLPDMVDELAGCTCDDPTVAEVAELVANGMSLFAACRLVYGTRDTEEAA